MKKSYNLRFILLLLTIAIVSLVSSCKQFKTGKKGTITKAADTAGWVTVDTSDFSIKMPKSWKHEVKQGKFTMLFLLAPRDDNFTPNLNALSQPVGNVTMDDYVKANAEQLKEMDVHIDTTGDMTIDGLQGKYFMSRYLLKGHPIGVKTYFVLYNGNAYVLTGTTEADNSDRYYPIFDGIVSTLKIKRN
jgi:hypothetical protein